MLISKKINILSLLNHSVYIYLYSTFFRSFDTYVHTPLRCAAPHSMTGLYRLSITLALKMYIGFLEFCDLHFFIFNVKLLFVKILLKN